MNKLDLDYQNLLQDILDNGVEKSTRNGKVLSVFGRTIRHKMSDGFPLLTTKKMAWKQIVTELLWFLKGDTNIKYLVENDCHIWNDDCYKRYADSHTTHGDPNGKTLAAQLPSVKPMYHSRESFIETIKTDAEFAKRWGNLGPIYGKQWRSWKKPHWTESELSIASGGVQGGSSYTPIQIDQIANLINDLKTNPDSRRLMVSAWNVSELDQMVLPPCHNFFQFYTTELSREERIDLYCKEYKFGLRGKYEAPFDDFIDAKLTTRDIPKRKISLMWNQRSVDTFLGLPFNIASYGLLLEILAKEVNMVPYELIGNLGDTHLYLNHVEQAREQIGAPITQESLLETYPELKAIWQAKHDAVRNQNYDRAAQLREIEREFVDSFSKQTREPFPLPTLHINTEFWKTETGECGKGPLDTNLQGFEIDDFILKNYLHHPAIKAPLSN